mgnify:CR=1 FL=1
MKTRRQFSNATLVILAVAGPFWWFGLTEPESEVKVKALYIGGTIGFFAILVLLVACSFYLGDSIRCMISPQEGKVPTSSRISSNDSELNDMKGTHRNNE